MHYTSPLSIGHFQNPSATDAGVVFSLHACSLASCVIVDFFHVRVSARVRLLAQESYCQASRPAIRAACGCDAGPLCPGGYTARASACTRL